MNQPEVDQTKKKVSVRNSKFMEGKSQELACQAQISFHDELQRSNLSCWSCACVTACLVGNQWEKQRAPPKILKCTVTPFS